MIKINANLPVDMEAFSNRASELIAEILVNRLQPTEVDELVKVLQDDSIKITM